MAWLKTDTHTWVDPETFFDHLTQTIMPANGWTFASKTGAGSNDIYYFMTRTMTNARGDVLNHIFMFEIEPASDDISINAWDGVSANIGTTLYTDLNYGPFSSTDGPVQTWADDSSDGFFCERQGKIFVFQFPEGGFLSSAMNVSSPGNTRPYYVNSIIGEYNYKAAIGDGTPTTHGTTSWDVPHTESTLWQNLAQAQIQNNIFWEDQTDTWKQKAYRTSDDWEPLTVAKIGSEYYLNVGSYLIPAGTTEPVL